jgi:hypothetical protein
VLVLLYFCAGVIATTGLTLIHSGIRSERLDRRGLYLAEGLPRFQPSFGDEAEVWLQRQ